MASATRTMVTVIDPENGAPVGEEMSADATLSSTRDCEQESKLHESELRLDSNGLPLIPQPSKFRDDPLNWPSWLKWAVLLQVGFMAFLGPYNAALVNPSLVLLSKSMGTSPQTAAYSTTTAIILGGISPFILTPLTNVYGRRPITLLAILLTLLGGVGSGSSKTFAALLGTRAMCGFGFGGMMSVGTSCVNDMFFLHERGAKTGVYSIFITNGAHIAALIGGFLGQSQGWEWDYYLGAMSTAPSLILALFLFPETLFSHDPVFLSTRPVSAQRTYTQLLLKPPPIPPRHIKSYDFLHSFHMLAYPSVVFPLWYYTVAWTFINVLPAISIATIYTEFYSLKPGPIGAALGISLTIGSVLGESLAGRASDYLVYYLSRSSSSRTRNPEHRLYLTVLSAAFIPLGLILFGATVGRTSFLVPLVGLALGAFGLQIASTCLYSYISDCYRLQTPECGVLFNFGRGLSFVVGYFALPFAQKIGFPGAWGTFAGVVALSWVPIAVLMVWGERWRDRMGVPGWNQLL